MFTWLSKYASNFLNHSTQSLTIGIIFVTGKPDINEGHFWVARRLVPVFFRAIARISLRWPLALFSAVPFHLTKKFSKILPGNFGLMDRAPDHASFGIDVDGGGLWVGKNFAFVFCERKAFGGHTIKPRYLIRFVPFPFCYTPKQLQTAEGRF